MSDWENSPPDVYPFEIHGEPELVSRMPLTPKRFRYLTAIDGSIIPQDGRDDNERES